MEKYNNFAYYYDELMADVDYSGWYDFFKSMLEKEKVNYSKVLEMGCGTGNITEEIYRDSKVRSITCFDLSEDMLVVAREKLAGYRNIKVLKQDMNEIELTDSYDLVISACDSINYIVEDEKLMKLFRKVYSLLNKGGAFIFDINSYNKLKNTIGNNTFIEDRDGIYYVWENEYREDMEEANFYLTFFIEGEDGKYERFDEHHVERAYRDEDIEKYLLESGFESVKLYHDFELNKKHSEDVERSFFIAIK